MQVKRDFDELYATETDPWQIGEADSRRYELYRELILAAARRRGTILDIGCGFGAFLARFHGEFDQLTGVELSRDAIAKGSSRFPEIRFLQGSAARLDRVLGDDERFDAILYSDVIYYLNEEAKRRSLRWLRDHLHPDGLAFVAGWCPGNDWLQPDELRRLVARYFHVESERLLDSEHALFFGRRARRLAAVTVDYETWQPVPEGEVIDWDATVFRPATSLMEVAEASDVPLTFMAEMGEYFWLCEHEAGTARRMERQWREALGRGHDLQLHLHPSWLPELGARRAGQEWSWDFSVARAADYPGDLVELIGRCRSALEGVLREERDDYRVRCFRAGTYQAQPFDRLYEALVANGIDCDSSVFAGGHSAGRGYDYRLAYSPHGPYFANRFDPQLKAPPAERGIVELPIFTFEPGMRWFLDGSEGPLLAERLLRYLRDREESPPSSERYRLERRLRDRLLDLYSRRPRWRPWINRLLPRRLAHRLVDYPRERLVPSDYFVMIGHTKGPHDFDAIREGLARLTREGDVRFVTLGEMAGAARDELAGTGRGASADEAAYQVERESAAVLGEERNEAQSFHLQEMLPWDRDRILDLGCGAGYWSERIAALYPWMRVLGLDYGLPFIGKARDGARGDRTHFAVGTFDALPLPDGCMDCVYADNTLEHAFDVDLVLSEVHRVLRPGGVLVAALPSDARNPARTCDNHNWKTAPHEVQLRMAAAGFRRVELDEIDTYRRLGMSPYPPSNDRMIYLRAWKGQGAELRRALDAMGWVYRRLDPSRSSEGQDALRILEGGHAWCWGSAVVLGRLLAREGLRVRWLTMIAHDHPRGRGEERSDSHEVLCVELDGREGILDPMANVWFPHTLEQLLARPELARPSRAPDGRWRERGYHLYATDEWYRRVRRYAVRTDPDAPPRWIDR